MSAYRTSPSVKWVIIHLLDSAQGQPLQSWRFADREVVTIGRGDDNDIVIVNPQVSRTHAKLVQQDGSWTLISVGRHGTLVGDHVVSEAPLHHQMVFHLGVGGPMFRFDSELPEPRRSETIAEIQTDVLTMLAVDDLRKEQEVEQITSNALFQELQEQSRRLRKQSGGSPEPS